MTCGLVKLICERDYDIEQGAGWPPSDVRVFHSPEPLAEQIARWFLDRGWAVHREPI